MTQPDLLTAVIQPCDSHVLHPEEQVRLSAQSARILARLQQGPASNGELAQIALRFGARLMDLRRAGYRIAIVERDHKSGRVLYALEQKETPE